MVPVSGPVAQISLLSGDSGSTLGSISLTRYLDARPREPRYSLAQSMRSGSEETVPVLRLTRRIFPAQDMCVTPCRNGSGRALVAQLVSPGLHLVDAGPVGIDVGAGAGRAGRGAGRVTAAQVALLDLAGFLDVVHRAEGAADGADLAAHAGGLADHLGAGGLVDRDGLDRAGVQAPGLVALGAGVGHLAPGLVEIEDLDARLGRREHTVVFVGAGHFALQATRALFRVDVKALLHEGVLRFGPCSVDPERAGAVSGLCNDLHSVSRRKPRANPQSCGDSVQGVPGWSDRAQGACRSVLEYCINIQYHDLDRSHPLARSLQPAPRAVAGPGRAGGAGPGLRQRLCGPGRRTPRRGLAAARPDRAAAARARPGRVAPAGPGAGAAGGPGPHRDAVQPPRTPLGRGPGRAGPAALALPGGAGPCAGASGDRCRSPPPTGRAGRGLLGPGTGPAQRPGRGGAGLARGCGAARHPAPLATGRAVAPGPGLPAARARRRRPAQPRAAAPVADLPGPRPPGRAAAQAPRPGARSAAGPGFAAGALAAGPGACCPALAAALGPNRHRPRPVRPVRRAWRRGGPVG